MDLTSNGDADGKTHIIIRNGFFYSIVGGNKDTFDQGESHEYANWADPNTNKHTTLTGNVQIDVYGGGFGGKFNIDVGDTCCNTSVTPSYLYGGGLGSDTVGDVTINVYGLAKKPSNYNNTIVGGGFGMAGDESDQTLYDDQVKHTGIVDGNVNLNLLGGRLAEFYGGGFHNGSAFKRNENVTGERFNQIQYHREEVAVVTGDVNLVMGGDMALCENSATANGGSYASTIQGDVNITIKDNVKMASKRVHDLTEIPTPQSMNELMYTYAEYYDGMYGGYGWRNAFYCTGEYDIIGGSVNVDIQDGTIWAIHGTPEIDSYPSLPLENTEIRNNKNAKAGMQFNISGGMIRSLYGDYYSGTIADGIDINVDGGEIFSCLAYDGGNKSLSAGSAVNVNISDGVIYALSGQNRKLEDGVTSTLNCLPPTKDASKIGYIEGFNNVHVQEKANALIDAMPVMEQFEIDPKKFAAEQDEPFSKNVHHLDIDKEGTLTTCKNKTHLLGNVENTEGTWLANGKVIIDKDCSGNGTFFFKQPALVEGQATWDNALLLLPVVESGKNYDGATNENIALTVGGESKGKALVRTVQAENHTQAVNPTVGDNYVLSAKNGDAPLAVVYELENVDAIKEGYYLNRVDDPKADHNNYMWQVAKGITVQFDKNGGDTDANPTQLQTPMIAGETEYKLGVPTTNPTREGYTFTGWNTRADGKGTPYTADTAITDSLTVYAQWKANESGGATSWHYLHYESNGGTKYDDEKYRQNTVVKLEKMPSRVGYTFTGWYEDKDLTKKISNIKMNSDKTVYAGWRKSTVPEMLNGDDHIAYVFGYTDGTVQPEGNIIRAEVASIFYRLLQEDIKAEYTTDVNDFDDVNEDLWFNTTVSTMEKLNIVAGRGDHEFAPYANITRAEFAAICARFDTGISEGDSNFSDISGHWAEKDIERAVALGWISGYEDGTFRPDNFITRAEAMSMINRVLCRLPETEDDLLDDMKTWPDNQPGAWHYLAVQEATNSHTYEAKGEIFECWTGLIEG